MGHSERQRRRAHSQETPKIEERSFVAVLLWMTAKGGASKAFEIGPSLRGELARDDVLHEPDTSVDSHLHALGRLVNSEA